MADTEKSGDGKEAGASGWDALLGAMTGAAGAEAGLLLAREGGSWRKVMVYPPEDAVFRGAAQDRVVMGALGREAEGMVAGGEGGLWIQRFPGFPEVAVVLRGAAGWPGPGEGARMAMGLLAEVPGLRREVEPSRRLGGRVENMALVLDLVVLVNGAANFREAVLKVVNEMAARCGCQRVSLGLRKNGFCRLAGLSHADKVERKTGMAKALEAAMDECADQDAEIVVPRPAGALTATHDHEKWRQEARSGSVASLPLRDDREVVGVLTVERDGEFPMEVLTALRLTADLLGPVLAGMERRSRWLGARAWHGFRKAMAGLLGHQHTGWKLLGLSALAAILVLIFGKMDYRVEATFMVESDEVAMVSAPFDGFLDSVRFHVGDEVKAGEILFTLDTRELSLEEARLAAECAKQRAMAQKAEAEGKLPDMRMARAAEEEAEARLGLTRHRLAQSNVVAPFDGVLIEGDLKEKLGAPLRQGDVMIKLVRLDQLYLELAIEERDIGEVRADATGEIAFTADPARIHPVRIQRIEPAARPKEGANVFLARALPKDGIPEWWRPGMAGVAKIEVGRRSFGWVLTHRTVDFLRMKLWW